MGILNWLLRKRGSPHFEGPCAQCKDKVAALKQEHHRQRARIDQMTADLDAAAMNGEERWFLQLQKKKEGCQHG